jgi:ring-1,2-phenylacetyl-CoA epoxidase subunit PaaE
MTTSTVRPTARRAAFHPLRVASVEPLCDDAAAVTFDVPVELAEAYAFLPGQSLTLRRTIEGREERRSYSICAPAGAAPRIGVREVPGGLFSSWLVHDLRPGDEVEVQTPTGSFSPAVGAAGRHVLVAAGSGITPLLSIASSLLAEPDTFVHAGLRQPPDQLGHVRRGPGRPQGRLRAPLRPRARAVAGAAGGGAAVRSPRRTRLRTILELLVPVDAVDHFWLCGPFGMVVEAREVLSELGVPADRVHTELFYVDDVPPEPVRHEEPGIEGPSSEVTVVLDGRSTTLTLPRDLPVLDSAQKSRADLPFACKGGVCGTCRARIVDGQRRHAPQLRAGGGRGRRGFVLTCQSYPVSDAVTVGLRRLRRRSHVPMQPRGRSVPLGGAHTRATHRAGPGAVVGEQMNSPRTSASRTLVAAGLVGALIATGAPATAGTDATTRPVGSTSSP